MSYLRHLPKVELHCHLEGSVPASTAVELARRNDVALPTTDPDRLYDFSTLEEFLDIYQAVSRAMATPGDFATATYDCLADAAQSSRLCYRELAFNPTNHAGVALGDMLSAMSDGAESAEADHGVRSRFIVAINREQPPEVATDLVRAVIALDHPRIVGIGLDHNELAGPPALFAEAFALAGAAGLRRTAHAGERGDVLEVEQSLELLGLERVDHGYAVLHDPALISRCIADGVHYAACWSTAGFHAEPAAGSPIPDMIAAGLSVSINSDDPPMFGTDIGREYEQAGPVLGWDPVSAMEFVWECARSSFLPDAEREQLIRELDAELDPELAKPTELAKQAELAESSLRPGASC